MMVKGNFHFGIYCVLCLMLLPNVISGQVSSSITISVDSAGLGDPITLDVKIRVPSGVKLKNLDFSAYKKIMNQAYQRDTINMDEFADVEVLDFGDWKHDALENPVPIEKIKLVESSGDRIIENKIKIAVYNQGTFSIPAPIVNTDSNDIINVQGESKNLVISLPENLMKKDTLIFNPIKNILKEDANISDYMVYIYILAGISLMALVGYYFYKSKNKKQQLVPVMVEIKIPCHEKALTALRLLDQKQLWQQGLIKEYQSGLTEIVREYLKERYNFNAMEMTTDEIISELNKTGFDNRYNHDLTNILQIADLVKFAKAEPEENIHSSFMSKAVDFIENTKETISEVNEV